MAAITSKNVFYKRDNFFHVWKITMSNGTKSGEWVYEKVNRKFCSLLNWVNFRKFSEAVSLRSMVYVLVWPLHGNQPIINYHRRKVHGLLNCSGFFQSWFAFCCRLFGLLFYLWNLVLNPCLIHDYEFQQKVCWIALKLHQIFLQNCYTSDVLMWVITAPIVRKAFYIQNFI